jgi:hypothetical protein
MPDEGVSRKRQISSCRIRKPSNDSGTRNRRSQTNPCDVAAGRRGHGCARARRKCVLDLAKLPS